MGKNYWFKNKNSMMKRHDITILAQMQDGLTYCGILWFLMSESVDHDAKLRFSEKKPYTARTLSPLCHATEERMKEAMKLFQELELIEILEDGTIFIPLVAENIGSEANNDNANRQRRFRERNADALQNVTDSVTKCNAGVTQSVTERNESIEIRDKRLEIRDKRIDNIESGEVSDETPAPPKPKKRFVVPSLEEVQAYCTERNNGIDAQRFIDFYSAKNWYVGKNKMVDWKACIRTWENRNKSEIVYQKKKSVDDIPIMENKYSAEHLAQKEKESDEYLDQLLAEL